MARPISALLFAWFYAFGILSLVAILWLGMPRHAWAQDRTPAEETHPTSGLVSDSVAKGQAIAKRRCARCHAIGRTGNSPHDAAPPFRSFASKWPLESLEEALAEGIVTGHPDMPEFVFTPEEISDFLAFLHSISPSSPAPSR